MPSQTFSERVVKLARSIPPGHVTTYGDLARAAGAGPMASQSITSILGKAYNNGIKDIPFHRIVYAGGKIWINDEYREKRLKLYKKEGIKIDEKGRVVDFEDIRV
jgi:alkylated DNA nucleotide flippase Atl1